MQVSVSLIVGKKIHMIIRSKEIKQYEACEEKRRECRVCNGECKDITKHY